MLDYLIIGQGIAGTLLAHFLEKEGQQIMVVDPGLEGSSTVTAAGLMNPITGRRYVKSWRVDELLPFARATYRELEEKLHIRIFHPRHILRTLFNAREENDWLLRTGDPAYQPYMLEKAELGAYHDHTEPAYSYGEVQHSAQVDIGDLARAFRHYLQHSHRLLEETFDHSLVRFQPDGVHYRDLQARAVVFAEGYRAKDNPFFNYLPFGGAKGEVLIVRIPDAGFEKVLKHRIFIAPLGNDLYWIGNTNHNRFDHLDPTPEGKAFLLERLQDLLRLPFEIVSHQAAVRPTVRDRRPFLGAHPGIPNCFIFNGLGTKGTSLGPFWARHLTQFLLLHQPLDPEVDIRRFGALAY